MDRYDPLTDPFDLPLQRLGAQCRGARPLTFPARHGVTPGATLASAFGTAVVAVACRRCGVDTCPIMGDGTLDCRQSATCPSRWLYKPASAAQRKTFPRPVLLHSDDLERGDAETFRLDVTLWGRHAVAYRPIVLDTLHAMGRAGLDGDDGSVSFAVEEVEEHPPRLLRDLIAPLRGASHLLLEFATPFIHYVSADSPVHGRTRVRCGGGEAPPLVEILANVAYELVAWDLEDREHSGGEEVRQHLARVAREAAREAATALVMTRADLADVDLSSHRRLRGNRREFPLSGFVGGVELTGDLVPALPWLTALAAGRGGQRRALGFGVVRVWAGYGPW